MGTRLPHIVSKLAPDVSRMCHGRLRDRVCSQFAQIRLHLLHNWHRNARDASVPLMFPSGIVHEDNHTLEVKLGQPLLWVGSGSADIGAEEPDDLLQDVLYSSASLGMDTYKIV